MRDQTHYLGDGCTPPHAFGQEPPVGIEPPVGLEPLTMDDPVGPEIRHLTVTTGDIDRLLGWYAVALHTAGPADGALAVYLREMRDPE